MTQIQIRMHFKRDQNNTEEPLEIDGHTLGKVNTFKYPGVTISNWKHR